MRRRRRERIKRTEKRLKGKVTFRTIFLLAVTLIFNTYAAEYENIVEYIKLSINTSQKTS